MRIRHAWLLVGLVLALAAGNLANAQGPFSSDLSPITPDNAAQVGEIARLGRGWLADVAWSPDEGTLAVASSVGVWLYNAHDWDAEPRLLAETDAPINAVAWSPDGARLAGADDSDIVHIWDPVGNTPPQMLQGEGEIVLNAEGKPLGPNVPSNRWAHAGALSVAWAPDGTRLVTGHADGTVRLWDATQAAPPRIVIEAHPESVVAVAWAPDGRSFVSGSMCFLRESCHGYDMLGIWDADTGAPIVTPTTAVMEETAVVEAVVNLIDNG